jgi:hypothetical protein
MLWCRQSNGRFDEIEFGLNVRNPSKLHVEDGLVFVTLPELLLKELALLLDFNLKRNEACGEVGCHRGFSSRGFCVRTALNGLHAHGSDSRTIQPMR